MNGLFEGKWKAALAGAIFALAVIPASAHHSLSMYNRGARTTVSGTVKEFEWVNPHSWIHLMVMKDDGTSETWSFEGGGPGRLERAGWSKDMLKPGDTISVTYNPKRDGTMGGLFQSVVMSDGKTYELTR